MPLVHTKSLNISLPHPLIIFYQHLQHSTCQSVHLNNSILKVVASTTPSKLKIHILSGFLIVSNFMLHLLTHNKIPFLIEQKQKKKGLLGGSVVILNVSYPNLKKYLLIHVFLHIELLKQKSIKILQHLNLSDLNFLRSRRHQCILCLDDRRKKKSQFIKKKNPFRSH